MYKKDGEIEKRQNYSISTLPVYSLKTEVVFDLVRIEQRVDRVRKLWPKTNKAVVWDHLVALYEFKSTKLDGLHPIKLKELADIILEPLSIIFEDWRRESGDEETRFLLSSRNRKKRQSRQLQAS